VQEKEIWQKAVQKEEKGKNSPNANSNINVVT